MQIVILHQNMYWLKTTEKERRYKRTIHTTDDHMHSLVGMSNPKRTIKYTNSTSTSYPTTNTYYH